jgi:hypothetical protein
MLKYQRERAEPNFHCRWRAIRESIDDREMNLKVTTL